MDQINNVKGGLAAGPRVIADVLRKRDEKRLTGTFLYILVKKKAFDALDIIQCYPLQFSVRNTVCTLKAPSSPDSK